jgi:hypothetical protein
MFSINRILLFILLFSLFIFLSCGEKNTDKSIAEEKQNNPGQIQDSTNNKETVNDTVSNINSWKIDSLKLNSNKKINNDSLNLKKKSELKLVAYYFHPTSRCVTCRNIEAYSIEAIQSWQGKTGNKIIWRELNIDDSVNEHYIKDYNLEFSSLILAQYSGSSRIKWKNLSDTWKLVNDKPTFLKYVNFELSQFVKNKN